VSWACAVLVLCFSNHNVLGIDHSFYRHASSLRKSLQWGRKLKADVSCYCLDQEIDALNREKNAITYPVSQIPGYATE